MSTTPTPNHKEEARAIQLPFPCGCLDAYTGGELVVEEYTCASHRAIAAALSSRDQEIREVLEGLSSLRVYTHGQPERCWCDADAVETPHLPACLAARVVWERMRGQD